VGELLTLGVALGYDTLPLLGGFLFPLLTRRTLIRNLPIAALFPQLAYLANYAIIKP
jgi:hypothetical protein